MNPGTEQIFTSAGGDVVIDTSSCVADGDGATSAVCELAAAWTTDRPDEYAWTCEALFQDGTVLGETLDLYLAGTNSTGTYYDGGITASNASFTDSERRV